MSKIKLKGSKKITVDLDKLAEITESDIQSTLNNWAKNSEEKFKTLLEAESTND